MQAFIPCVGTCQCIALSQIRTDVLIIVKGLEQKLGRCRQFLCMLSPGGIHIAAVNRQRLVLQDISPTPGGHGVVWHNKAEFLGHLFQGAEMFQPFCFGLGALVAVAVFIFNLDADHRPSVLAHHALGLFRQLRPVTAHMGQIPWIVLPQGEPALNQPVGETAVAAFAVIPRPDPQPHRHLQCSAGFQKTPQIPGAGEVPLVLLFFMVNPENIAGNDSDAACPHFEDRFPPLVRMPAGKVELPHHRQDRPAVLQQIPAVHLIAITVLGFTCHRQHNRLTGVSADAKIHSQTSLYAPHHPLQLDLIQSLKHHRHGLLPIVGILFRNLESQTPPVGRSLPH